MAGKACVLRNILQLSTLRNTPVSDLHDWSDAKYDAMPRPRSADFVQT